MKSRKRTAIYVLSSLIAIPMIFPVVWMFILSFRPPALIMSGLSSLFSSVFTTQNYIDAFERTPLFGTVINNLVVATSVMSISLVVSILAGYSLGRWQFPGRTAILGLFLTTQLFPLVQLMIPLYVFMRALNLVDTLLGLTLSHLSFTVPFCVWMMTAYVRTIPPEIDEAATVDGCSKLQIIRSVFIPIAKPGITAVAIFAFIMSWEDFICVLMLMQTGSKFLLSLLISTYMAEVLAADYGMVMAMAVIYTVPVILLFMLLQRYLVTGLAAGAVRG